jgi:hypothetical protein
MLDAENRLFPFHFLFVPREADMTVDEFAEVLRNPDVQVTSNECYHNQQRKRGYRANLSLGSNQYWYSVSNTDMAMTAAQVATAIMSPSRKIIRQGDYCNFWGEVGFEATVLSDGHAYMLVLLCYKQGVPQ